MEVKTEASVLTCQLKHINMFARSTVYCHGNTVGAFHEIILDCFLFFLYQCQKGVNLLMQLAVNYHSQSTHIQPLM